jgi:multimeric flavodoxin WrbA
MRILVLNGSPKSGGFIGGSLDVIAAHLERNGVDVIRVSLRDRRIDECVGCFNCLKTGACGRGDDVDGIIQELLDADGIVIGSPVRNGMTTALYKRFYERITYRLGFTLLLEGKYTLAISSVGLASGKGVNRKFLGLQDIGPHRSAYLFFRVGIPTAVTPEDVRPRLERAADTLLRDVKTGRSRNPVARFAAALDRMMIRRWMLTRSPEAYAHVIDCWKRKDYM